MQMMLQAYTGIAAQLGITTAEQFDIFVQGTKDDVQRHIAAADPVEFVRNPPAPRSNADAAAICVATAYLGALCVMNGQIDRQELEEEARKIRARMH